MKRILAFVAVTAAITAPAASAHRSSWFWGAGKAEKRLVYSSYGRQLGITRATCRGKGGSLATSVPSVRLYQHFDCYLNTRRGRYYGVLHVLTRDTFLFTIQD